MTKPPNPIDVVLFGAATLTTYFVTLVLVIWFLPKWVAVVYSLLVCAVFIVTKDLEEEATPDE